MEKNLCEFHGLLLFLLLSVCLKISIDEEPVIPGPMVL